MNPHYPFVSARARHICEYCHAPEVVFNLPFEVEHIEPQAPEVKPSNTTWLYPVGPVIYLNLI